MITLQEYWEDLVENVQLDYSSKLIPPASAFFDRTTNTLAQVGDLDKEVYTGFSSEFAFNGFAFRSESGTLQLVSVIYSSDEQKGLLKSEIESVFKRLEKLITFISKKKYQENSIEETSEFYDCCSEIYNLIYKEEIRECQFILITDSSLPKSMYHIESKKVGEIQYSYSVYDINYFYQIHKNGNQYASFVLDTNLPCLTVNNNNNDYVSYLTVISGQELASIYGKYKSKLLEENVRTFLQFRGDVNKGIRYTLQNKPDYFFAYNNGITATATDVEIEHNCIVRINNLQIVNGGQTTASIYFSKKKFPEIDLASVRIPAKIIILKSTSPEDEESLVSDISRYANSQNSVKQSDLAANKPFHVEIEKLATSTYCPNGIGRWFYERAAGSYNTLLTREGNTPAKLKALKTDVIPSSRKITNTDLAKYMLTWDRRHDLVSLGSQKNFEKFMDYINTGLDGNPLPMPTVSEFKNMVSKAIIYKKTSALVRPMFPAFQGNVATYLVAMLSEFHGHKFNFERVWSNQDISTELKNQLKIWAGEVNSALHKSSSGRMISEWAKKSECWDAVKEGKYSPPADNIPELN
jgi:hypothetical protein